MAVNVYKINGNGLRIPVLASDPGSPENGMMWYNSTDNVFRKFENGSTSTISSGTATDALDGTFLIENTSDPTKAIAFDASGISTGTTRTISMPDVDVNLGKVATAIQADGSVTYTANQPMDSHKLTGLSAGSTTGDSVRYEQAILISGANAFAADQSMGSHKLTNVTDPASAQDAATKNYVDTNFANNTLSNLGATAINADLIPDGTTRTLGSVSDYWSAMWIKELLYPSAIDFHLDTGLLYNSSGSNIADFTANKLNDNSDNLSIDWQNRLLVNPSGTTLADWSSASLQLTAGADFNSAAGTNLADPTNPQDAATKAYVDSHSGTASSALDGTFVIKNTSDDTKKIAFLASGISTGTTRTILMPDSNVDLGLVLAAIQKDGSVTFTANQAMGSHKLTGLSAGSTAGDSVRYEQAILIDGSNTFTANQAMGSHKLTGLSAGTTAGDSVRYEQAILISGVNAFAANQDMGGNRITGMSDPSSASDAATKNYVDSVALGLAPKKAVRAASTANVIIATDLIDGSTMDGITLATGDRVLLKDQTLPQENGIYIVVLTGPASRSTDMDSLTPIDEVNGAWVPVELGTANAGRVYVEYSVVAILDTDPINFEFYNPIAALTGGDMITVSGSTISVDLATASGLESTNPGNATGQLRVKLEASNPTLKFSGSNELGSKLDAARAITTGASGIGVNVDGSTIDISANAIEVKAGGITDTQVAAGIDAAKIGSGAVSNTEFGYLDGVTSAIQTQFSGKLSSVSQDTTPSLGGNLSTGTNVLVYGANGLRIGSSGSVYFEEIYSEDTLTASSTSAVLSSLSFDTTVYEGLIVNYKVKEATSGKIRVGSLYITSNGTNTGIVDTMTETADVGLTWDVNMSGSTAQVRYTTTANNKVMKSVATRIKV